MEILSVNYLAILVGSVLSMIIGSIWYGPLFGKKWMEIIGVSVADAESNKKMMKAYLPMYILQFILTLFQVLVLAHLIADTKIVGGLERSLWIWAAFVIPSIAGSVMWTNEKQKCARFLIQGGYQFVLFIVFGLILQYWK